MDQYRVLILSANFGGGHVKTGEALVEQFRTIPGRDVAVQHIDFGSFFSKTDFLIRLIYMNMVKKTPELYRLLFDKTADYTAECYRKLMKGFNSDHFLHYIRLAQPDIIVCTHFLPAGVIAEYKLNGLLNIPVVSVITDYKVHGLWIHSAIDHFLVGSGQVKRRLAEAGINAVKIKVTGIPVRSCFLQAAAKTDMRIRLGLDRNRPTILVMGGASGLGGKASAIRDYLLQLEKEEQVQFLIICGSDSQLYHQLADVKTYQQTDFKVYGYVENVHEIMGAADILVTKGGALTLSEGLTMKLPVIMYKPIPGHEDGNAAFVEQSGAGMIAHSVQELTVLTKQLLAEPALRAEMQNKAARLLPRNSANQAAHYICRIAEQYGVQKLREEAIG